MTAHARLPNGLEIAQVNEGETALLFRDIFTERCYMQHGISLAPGGVVVDVGANIGLSTLFFHVETPGLRFYSIEPAPLPFAALAENISMHLIDAVPIRSAVSNCSGNSRFSYYPGATVMSGLHADAASEAELTRIYLLHSGFSDADAQDMLEGMHDLVEFDCAVVTLSEVIATHSIERIDLLKVDVEKSELEVLEGVAAADWPKISQVVAEVHDLDGQLETVTGLLREQGFQVEVDQDELLAGTAIHEVFARRTEAVH